jgi:hypothetical protein
MNELPFFYNRVSPTTWVHLSSLLTIAIFFKFSRLWSVRNLDLIALILVAPGLLAAQYGHTIHSVQIEQAGYLWLFAATLWFLVRTLIDPMMVRRPLLEPNLSVGGLTFLGIALYVFLMANVLTGVPEPEEHETATAAPTSKAPNADGSGGAAAAAGVAHGSMQATEAERIARQGPGYPPLFRVPNFVTQRMQLRDDDFKLAAAEAPQSAPQTTQQPGQLHPDLVPPRIALVLLHLSVVIGLVLIGYRHFDNVKTGIAAAVLYLMIPYTAEFTGCLRHVLPAALLVWALVTYRRPTLSGLFMGLAIGLSYYPLFLLPLWLSFYWQRGLVRFLGGLLPAIGVLVGLLAIWAPGREAFIADVQQTFGWIIPQMQRENFEGFWGQPLSLLDPVYRIPILAAFIALSATMTIWPAQKNLGSLISCSAALMLGTQFWDAHRGGLFIGWYLPLLLLTIFRPNLEDRVALSVLGEGWFPKRRPHSKRIGRAA